MAGSKAVVGSGKVVGSVVGLAAVVVVVVDVDRSVMEQIV